MTICSRTGEVRGLVEGALDAETTRSLLDHVRSCAACDARFKMATSVLPTARSAFGPTPARWDTYRRGRGTFGPRALLAVVAVVMLTFVVMATRGRREPLPAEALAVVFPGERHEGRPRILEIAVPPGTVRVNLTVRSANGTWSAEVPGAEAGRVVLPFPGSDELPLAESMVIDVRVTGMDGAERRAERTVALGPPPPR